MNKADLAATIAEKHDLTKKASDDIVNTTFNSITDALKNGDDAKFIGFGNFTVKERAARKGRNPATGEEIDIAASKTVAFKAGKALKDAIK